MTQNDYTSFYIYNARLNLKKFLNPNFLIICSYHKQFFAILSLPLESPFKITIPEEGIEVDGVRYLFDQIDFRDLKTLLHKNKPNICTEDEVDKLKLWRIENLSEGNEVWKKLENMLETKDPVIETIEKLGGKIIPTNEKVKGSSLLIPNGIIIVQLPSATTGKCLPMV
jgi:hypothetical protein